MSEIEKQFFETFGIEPKRRIGLIKIKEPSYPQITDHILLELICILADLYDSNSRDYPLSSKNIDELKEDILDDLMGAIDVANDCPEGYANKVRTLFKEDNQ